MQNCKFSIAFEDFFKTNIINNYRSEISTTLLKLDCVFSITLNFLFNLLEQIPHAFLLFILKTLFL